MRKLFVIVLALISIGAYSQNIKQVGHSIGNSRDRARVNETVTATNTNTTGVATNVTNIATNVTNIATNTTGLALHDTSYVALQADSANFTEAVIVTITGANGASITNPVTDTLKLTETVIQMIGRLVADLIFLTPKDTATAVEGTIYYDSDENLFYGRNNSAWVALDTQ